MLLERGDPRGELIVVGCELERCARHDPRRWELVARERDLLHAHEESWLGDLPDVGARWRLRRGFVEEAAVPAARAGDFLGALDRIAAAAPLLTALEPHRFGGLYHLAAHPIAARLRALRLTNPTAAALSALGQVSLPSLRELQIRTVFEEDEPPLVNTKYLRGALAALGGDRLRRLTLGGGAYEPPGLRLVAGAELDGLASLSLFDEDFTAADLAALIASPAWPGLTELELSRCRLGDNGAEAIARAAPPLLERLVIEGNGIGARGAAALARLDRLRELVISGNPLGDAGLAALAAGLPSLRILGAAETQVGAAGVSALARASFAPALVALDLGDNPLGERGGRALSSAPVSRLVSLRLSATHIGDAFVALAAADLTALRVLDVSSCGLDAPALATLSGRRLLELRAGGNDLGDDALVALAPLGIQVLALPNSGLGEPGVHLLLSDPRFTSLRRLDLNQNRLSARLVDALGVHFGRKVLGRVP